MTRISGAWCAVIAILSHRVSMVSIENRNFRHDPSISDRGPILFNSVYIYTYIPSIVRRASRERRSYVLRFLASLIHGWRIEGWNENREWFASEAVRWRWSWLGWSLLSFSPYLRSSFSSLFSFVVVVDVVVRRHRRRRSPLPLLPPLLLRLHSALSAFSRPPPPNLSLSLSLLPPPPCPPRFSPPPPPPTSLPPFLPPSSPPGRPRHLYLKLRPLPPLRSPRNVPPRPSSLSPWSLRRETSARPRPRGGTERARAADTRPTFERRRACEKRVDPTCAAQRGKRRNPGEIGGTLRDAGNVARPVPRRAPPTCARLALEVRFTIPFDEFFLSSFLSFFFPPVFCI